MERSLGGGATDVGQGVDAVHRDAPSFFENGIHVPHVGAVLMLECGRGGMLGNRQPGAAFHRIAGVAILFSGGTIDDIDARSLESVRELSHFRRARRRNLVCAVCEQHTFLQPCNEGRIAFSGDPWAKGNRAVPLRR